MELASLATTGYGRTNGQPAVTISVSKASTANTVTVANAVQVKLDELAARHPAEIEIATVSDQSVFILESSEGLLREGGLGAAFAVLTFPALLLTGRPIGLSALIGFLMLIGIVVTNAIVLLDLVERLKTDGHSTHDALVEGGRTRIRPILMTAIATIFALVPLAAGFNEGSIIAAELGTVVIGGLLSSTFLTLLVVPAVFSLVDGVKRRVLGGREAGSPRVHDAGELAPGL